MVAGLYCEFILKDKGNLVRVYSSSSREKGIRSFFGSEKKNPNSYEKEHGRIAYHTPYEKSNLKCILQ
jgi:hypothetical protein